MTDYRTIEIDLEVHKRIEFAKQSFAESENMALRRLLGIDTESIATTTGGRPWSGKGVSLPHGTNLKMEYNGRLHEGRIDEGRWLIEGEIFNSPSAAAGGVALTKAGTRPSLDGWIYWQVKRPHDEEWATLKSLRDVVSRTNQE